MDELKNLIANFEKEDYFEKVNLHIHSNCSDGVLSSHEIIKKAQKINLEHISITDHNSLEAYDSIDLDKIEDINVIAGIEFDCWHKTDFMHILGYGFDLNDKNLRKLCAKDKRETRLDIVRIFSQKKSPEVIKTIRDAGGISVLAHPACCWSLNLEKMVEELISYGLDGIELYYPYVRHRKIVKFHSIKKIAEIAEKNNLLITGGTDCHSEKLDAI
ncbi:MAG TPA: PHP domain-containing protein [Candidatus Gastranaerophilales bacterium]|nr:PHP domain-containing protein [Candidatus Gastranaerophilales bacterium]